MDPDQKKTALRMIPYGLYVLAAENNDGKVAAGTVNWVTQASFEPPLIAVAVKVDSFLHTLIKESGAFALNVLGKDQSDLAFKFFKPAEKQGQTLSGEPYHSGNTGAPILDSVLAFIECKWVDSIEKGDHSIFAGEVVEVGVNQPPEGRPDNVIRWLKDLGENIFYGG